MRGLAALGARDAAVYAIPLLSVLAGLGVVALAVALARRATPADPLRAALAGLLLLFLPAHLHMSAMVNEEMLVALLTSSAVFGLAVARAQPARGRLAGARWGSRRARAAHEAVRRASRSPRRRDLRGRRLSRAAARARPRAPPRSWSSRSLVGGWFHARSLLATGSPQPFGLPAHAACSRCRPASAGSATTCACRSPPSATRSCSNPDLLRSVWGSTFVTVWFDGHRYFLPRESRAVSRLGG